MGWRDDELGTAALWRTLAARSQRKARPELVARPKQLELFDGLSLISRTGRRRRLRFGFRQPPRVESLMEKLEDSGAVFGDDFPPGEAAEHGEINSPEAYASEKNIDAIAKRLVVERIDGVGNGFRTIGVGPAVAHLGVGFVDGHLEWGVGHVEWDKLLPVLGAG